MVRSLAMKILLVSHNFLPRHTAGTEVYTAQLAHHLVKRGHHVAVFTAEKEISLPHLSLRQRVYKGLPVTEVINNLHYADFRETWDQPEIARAFGAYLDRERPDVVHFQHLLYLSIGCVEEAARRYLGVVFTLHDYWLQCPRHGQRVHADSSICHTIDFARCGNCLTSFKFAQSSFERGTGRMLAALRDSTGIDLGPAAVGARKLLPELSTPATSAAAPPSSSQREGELAIAARDRDAAFRERAVPLVHRFLSPSRFLRERFIEWGIPPEQIQFLRTGIDFEPFAPRQRRREGPLRVAFIGTLAPHKGAHILVEAWESLPADLRARGSLELIGPSQHNPQYVRDLRKRCDAVGATMRGGMSRVKVTEALLSIDLLVVPSVWYENSPLVIIEAIAARTPLLVSDIGGMAELVHEGRSGFRFRVGDAANLAEHLARLIGDPTLLDALYLEDEPIKRVEQDAAQIEEVYFESLEVVRATLARSADTPDGSPPAAATDGERAR